MKKNSKYEAILKNLEEAQKPAADYLNNYLKSRDFEKEIQSLKKGEKFWIKIILLTYITTTISTYLNPIILEIITKLLPFFI